MPPGVLGVACDPPWQPFPLSQATATSQPGGSPRPTMARRGSALVSKLPYLSHRTGVTVAWRNVLPPTVASLNNLERPSQAAACRNSGVRAVHAGHVASAEHKKEYDRSGSTTKAHADAFVKGHVAPVKSDAEDTASKQPAAASKATMTVIGSAALSEPPSYFGRWVGEAGAGPPPRPSLSAMMWTGIGSASGIGALSVPHYLELVSNTDAVMLIGPFGATACLVYGVPDAPFSQPRNVFVGHVLSATVGVAVAELGTLLTLGPHVTAPAAVALSAMSMQATRSIHPPAAATALIAVLGSPKLQELGWWFPVTPVASGSAVLILVGVLVNNLNPARRYPKYWW